MAPMMGNNITIHNQLRLVLGLLKWVLFISEKAHPERKKPKSNRINSSLAMSYTNLYIMLLRYFLKYNADVVFKEHLCEI